MEMKAELAELKEQKKKDEEQGQATGNKKGKVSEMNTTGMGAQHHAGGIHL